MATDQPDNGSWLTEPEPTERLVAFTQALYQHVLELRVHMDTECEEMRVSGESFPPCCGDLDMGLSCIQQAARDVEWYGMMGLTAGAQDAMSRRDSQSLENWAKVEAAGKAERRAKREAAKQRRLAKQAENQQSTPE